MSIEERREVSTAGQVGVDTPQKQNYVSLLSNAIASISIAKNEAAELFHDITEGGDRPKEGEGEGVSLRSVPSLSNILDSAPDEIEAEISQLREFLRSIRDTLRV